MSKQVLYKDIAGVLWFTLPCRPTAIAITITKPDGSALPAAVSGVSILANLGTVNTTASGTIDTATLTVASATGIASETEYRIGANDVTELVRVKSISGTTLTLYDRLRHTFVSAALYDPRVYYSLASTQQDMVESNRVVTLVWTYASVVERATYLYDVLYHQFRCPLRHDDLKAYWPDMQRYQFTESADYEPQIAVALDRMRLDLRAAGFELDNLYYDEAVKVPLAYLALHVIGNALTVTEPSLRQWTEDQLATHRAELDKVKVAPVWYEQGAQDAVQSEEDIVPPPRYTWGA